MNNVTDRSEFTVGRIANPSYDQPVVEHGRGGRPRGRPFRDLANPARMGLRHHDLFESLVAADGLVGTHFVQALSLGPPLALAKLEKRSRVPSAREVVKWAGVEVHADQGQQVARLPVSRPKYLVVPLGPLPPLALGRISLAERRDEAGFQPLSLLVKERASVVDVDILNDLAKRPSQDHPAHEHTQRQDAGADQQSHGVTPACLPELATTDFIVESNHRGPQVTDFP
jgi:hypothetical protein